MMQGTFEQRQANGNVFGEQFAPREAQCISDHFIDIDGQLHRRCISRHRADAGNDLAGAVSVPDHAVDRVSCPVEVRLYARKPAAARIAAGDDGGQRLIDFMGYGSSQFAHRGQPRHPCQLGARYPERLFGLLLLRDINNDCRQELGIALGRRNRRAGDIDPDYVAVLPDHPLFDVIARLPSFPHRIEPAIGGVAVVRVS